MTKIRDHYIARINDLLENTHTPVAILQKLCRDIPLSEPDHALAKKIAAFSPTDNTESDIKSIARFINESRIIYTRFAGLLCALLHYYPFYEYLFSPSVLRQLPPRSNAVLHEVFLKKNTLEKMTRQNLAEKIIVEKKLEKADHDIDTLLNITEEALRKNDPRAHDLLRKAYISAPQKVEKTIKAALWKLNYFASLHLIQVLAQMPELLSSDLKTILLTELNDIIAFSQEKIEGHYIKRVLSYQRNNLASINQRFFMTLAAKCLKECFSEEIQLQDEDLIRNAIESFTQEKYGNWFFKIFNLLGAIKKPLSIFYQVRLCQVLTDEEIRQIYHVLTLPGSNKEVAHVLLKRFLKFIPDHGFQPALSTHPITDKNYHASDFKFLMYFLFTSNLLPADRQNALQQIATKKYYQAPCLQPDFLNFLILIAPFRPEHESWEDILKNITVITQIDETFSFHLLPDFIFFIEMICPKFSPLFRKTQIEALEDLYQQSSENHHAQVVVLTILSHFGLKTLQDKLDLTQVLSDLMTLSDRYLYSSPWFPKTLIEPLLSRLNQHLPPERRKEDIAALIRTQANLEVQKKDECLPLLVFKPREKQVAYLKEIDFATDRHYDASKLFFDFFVQQSLDQQVFLMHQIRHNDYVGYFSDIRAYHHCVSLIFQYMPVQSLALLLCGYIEPRDFRDTDYNEQNRNTASNYLIRYKLPTETEEKTPAISPVPISVDGHMLHPRLTTMTPAMLFNNNTQTNSETPSSLDNEVKKEFGFK